MLIQTYGNKTENLDKLGLDNNINVTQCHIAVYECLFDNISGVMLVRVASLMVRYNVACKLELELLNWNFFKFFFIQCKEDLGI